MAHRGHAEAGVPEFHLDPLCRVFDDFPHSVLLVDVEGAVMWANTAAIESLGVDVAGERPPTCCELLACGQTCIAHEARASDRPLPERQVELSGERAAWVSAMPLRFRHPDLVALHVRHTVEPSTTSMPAPGRPDPDLHVQVMGHLRVMVRGEALDGEWLVQRPGQLLRYLISTRPRFVSAEEIAGALGPDRAPSFIANVRYFVHQLREHLEPGHPRGAAGSLVQTGAPGYRLDPERLHVDADRFESQVVRGLGLLRQGQTDVAEAELAQALEIYRGDFLAEDRYADWALAEGGYLHRLAVQALRSLGEHSLEAGRFDAAGRLYSRLAEMEPFDPDIHERLIEVELHRGHRTDAVRRYTALRARMLRAFGQEPDFDLRQVAGRIAASG